MFHTSRLQFWYNLDVNEKSWLDKKIKKILVDLKNELHLQPL
jgi:hypothetical protein